MNWFGLRVPFGTGLRFTNLEALLLQITVKVYWSPWKMSLVIYKSVVYASALLLMISKDSNKCAKKWTVNVKVLFRGLKNEFFWVYKTCFDRDNCHRLSNLNSITLSHFWLYPRLLKSTQDFAHSPTPTCNFVPNPLLEGRGDDYGTVKHYGRTKWRSIGTRTR